MKRSWSILRYYPGICLEGLIKYEKPLDIRSPRVDFNTGPPKFEAGAITTRPQNSVTKLTHSGEITLSICPSVRMFHLPNYGFPFGVHRCTVTSWVCIAPCDGPIPFV
jgi:hypothetical protein